MEPDFKDGEKMQKIENRIYMLGKKLVRCDENCKDTTREDWRIPRCLTLETENRKGEKGVIIIGINPGHANTQERQFFKNHGGTYDAWKERFNHYSKRKIAYFERSRRLADELGFSGPILWTDLAKCELKDGNTYPSAQTLRICISNFLEKELKILPSYPIIALGNNVFNFCSLRFPERLVIGVPHPSGKWSIKTFNRMFTRSGKIKSKFKDELNKMKDEKGRYRAIRLFP